MYMHQGMRSIALDTVQSVMPAPLAACFHHACAQWRAVLHMHQGMRSIASDRFQCVMPAPLAA